MTERPNEGKNKGKQRKVGGASMRHLGPEILSLLFLLLPFQWFLVPLLPLVSKLRRQLGKNSNYSNKCSQLLNTPQKSLPQKRCREVLISSLSTTALENLVNILFELHCYITC